MNEPPIILTHCGKLGDFLYALPIAEWFYQRKQRQVHWVLPRGFPPFQHIARLLRMQPHCAAVTLVDHALANFETGGQPYQFNPAEHGVPGDYYNLGFRSYPDHFITAFYAQEHALGWWEHYRLALWPGFIRPPGDERAPSEILRSSETAMARLVPDATPLPPWEDLMAVARRIQAAREFHTWYCGLAVLAWFACIPQHVYRMPGHAPKVLYFPEDAQITWHEVEL